MQYEPNYESLKQHPVPEWFHDAKLGIFIHWGLFSVPAWAPPAGDLNEIIEREGPEAWFSKNPYAEWYMNSLRFQNGPTRQHHAETYGEDFTYEAFASMFNEAIAQWQPEPWAKLFAQIGARYVVLVTKHHDGFLLWPSDHSNPFKQGYQSTRDLVGELTSAVREQGMRMGLYYSGGLDWTFKDSMIRDFTTLYEAIPQTPDYVTYADAHWHELIDRYQPSILWNDIGYPAAANLPELFARFYNTVADGVINDRFIQHPNETNAATQETPTPTNTHFDYRTPEYTSYDQIMDIKWESTRGVGHSFGYNQTEGPEHHIPIDKLICLFVDIVSKNGNLLLNVGPMADGTIPDLQRERLEGLGAWLAVNGDAIFETHPWITADGRTTDGIDVRYTQKGDVLYATLLHTPHSKQVSIEGLIADPATKVQLLGSQLPLDWQQAGNDLQITLPDALQEAAAHAISITPAPMLASKES